MDFNGEFGCLHCPNPGTSTQRRRVYLGTNQETRYHSVYLRQLNQCSRVSNGIKCPTSLSNIGLKMPADVSSM